MKRYVGEPKKPVEPLRDVIQWTYSGNALHPNQKPLSVLTPLIVALSEPGDVVLDPFGGSGSTAVKDDNKLIVHAAAQAQRAADFVLGRKFEESEVAHD